jgi:3-oxoadipate enol-lactonase
MTSGDVEEGRRVVRCREVHVRGRGVMLVREAAGPRGAPTLILLDGLGTDAGFARDGMARIATLARRFRVIAPDRPGYGHFDDCADDVAALVRQERCGPVLLAGSSMDGPIAERLCRRHPDVVAGAALVLSRRSAA